MQRFSEIVHKALALDDSNATALSALSCSDWMQQRFDQAVADAERAVAINRNSAQGYQALSWALSNEWKPEGALRAAKEAMRLDPARQDIYAFEVGTAYNEMGRHDEAVTLFQRNLAAYPNKFVAHLALDAAYVELGRDDDAHAEAAEIMRISPHFAVASLQPIKDDTRYKLWQTELRKAGLK